MLLAHNYTLTNSSMESTVPALSPAEFAEVFSVDALGDAGISCTLIDHPHWMVELRFDSSRISPNGVGELCAQAFQRLRTPQNAGKSPYDILILGGLKTTPPRGTNPVALQTGEWGVDVVETFSADDFLLGIGWERSVGERPPEQVFKVGCTVPA
ncbi:MAG: DUF2656 family protein [Cyanobacteria bacterium J06648_16]